MSSAYPNIIRGKMTDADRAEIKRLAGSMTDPTPGKIALRIKRHPAAVKWFMLFNGLIERKPGRAPRVYVRNGITIYPYAEEHDARIEELRVDGKVYREIAAIITAEFGIKRTAHSVQVRMIQLAAAPDESEAA